MTPQFVDFNADGHMDIVTGTFDGSPHVSYGNADGFQQPSHILDSAGNRMILDQYWDFDKSQWFNLDGAQCISAVAFDWDDDGDYDLLLGDYKKGGIALRENAGTNAEPKFSTENVALTMGDGVPFAVEGGLSAPRLVDWDEDGLVDLVCGGMKGGVFLYRNTGAVGAPAFAMPETLIAKAEVKPDGPKFPNEGCYVDAADYDGDGDLDLLVGGYATWQPKGRVLTAEEENLLATLDAETEEISSKMMSLFETIEEKVQAADSDEARQRIYEDFYETEEVAAMMERQQEIYAQTSELRQMPKRQAGVWLYRRS